MRILIPSAEFGLASVAMLARTCDEFAYHFLRQKPPLCIRSFDDYLHVPLRGVVENVRFLDPCYRLQAR